MCVIRESGIRDGASLASSLERVPVCVRPCIGLWHPQKSQILCAQWGVFQLSPPMCPNSQVGGTENKEPKYSKVILEMRLSVPLIYWGTQ